MSSPLDPSSLSDEALGVQHRDLPASLVATNLLVRHLATALADPARLNPAAELLRSTLSIVEAPGSRIREQVLREVNLADATLLAVIDLVNAHTDVPRGPRKRPPD